MSKLYIEYDNKDLDGVELSISKNGLFLSFDMGGDYIAVDESDKALLGSLTVDLLMAGAKILSIKQKAKTG